MEVADYGTLVIRFFADKAPKTVENFKKLTTQGFYNNLTFHRVIKGFMMQGGCPRGDGTGDPGYKFEDEASGVLHAPGILSMANSGPNTNGSQFFICFEATPWLDGKHTTFGRVIEGLDVVFKVEKQCRVPDPKSGRPLKAPKMTRVEWHEKK
ncbi:MAG: peptidylprolyl isomerase [Planctomycetes bacterium]|nr:peptidylprolyl isomerase [Planctomycetota bacterium]